VDRERWQRLDDLFHEAVRVPEERRGAFLDEACGGDEELRAELEELIASDRGGDAFFEKYAGGIARLATALTGDVGESVGRYRLLRELGRGGMGTVMLAERADGEYDQQVAIKLVTLGVAAGDLLRRLREERQILARLEHPNIARLLDGGTTDQGAPYLVMEYVDGLPIDEHAETRDLSLEDRLRMFVDVCSAVEHAHEHGVIHRDIKPGNILVSGEGRPKLLDFGIAKVLDEVQAGEVTRTVARRLTPEYASPEQIQGAPVGPTTDVYALGGVLYRLLTGVVPHHVEGSSLAEWERVVCHTNPPAPSERVRTDPEAARSASTRSPSTGSWTQRLRGDLDNIALKALHHDPTRRYPSVRALREDLERYQRGEPVRARGDSWLYRGSRFARRHRIELSLGAVAVAAITALLVPRDAPLPAPGPVQLVENRVAVGVFANETGDPELAPLGAMTMDWIVDGLAKTGVVEVVPAVVSVAVFQQSDSNATATPTSMASRVAQETGAATVVSGAIYRAGDSLEFRARITDARTGALLQALEPIRTHVGEGHLALQPLRQQVTASLATVLNPRLSDYAMVIEQPPSYDAYEAFVRGVEAYVRLDDETALASWRRATQLEEDYASAHLASALPLINLGRLAEADSVARWVQGRGYDLAPLEEASMHFLLTYLSGDREEAYELAVRGAEVAPTSVLAYQAAREALDTRRFHEAIERISALDPTRGFMNGWVSYWTVTTQAHHALGDHGGELARARAGRAQYPGSMSMLAAEVQAQAARGRMWALGSLLGQAAELEPQLGWTVDRLGLTAVRELRAHGHRLDLWLAMRQLRSALRDASEPASPAEAVALALGFYEAGDWARVRDLAGAWEPRAADADAFRLAAVRTLAEIRLGLGDGASVARRLEADTAAYRFGEPDFWAMRIHAVADRPEAAASCTGSRTSRGSWATPRSRSSSGRSTEGPARGRGPEVRGAPGGPTRHAGRQRVGSDAAEPGPNLAGCPASAGDRTTTPLERHHEENSSRPRHVHAGPGLHPRHGSGPGRRRGGEAGGPRGPGHRGDPSAPHPGRDHRRDRRRLDELAGPPVRLLTHGLERLVPRRKRCQGVRVRPEPPLREGVDPQRLRTVLRAHGACRRPGQRLGGGRGLQHDHEGRPDRSDQHGARP